jgi:hypothetical protein
MSGGYTDEVRELLEGILLKQLLRLETEMCDRPTELGEVRRRRLRLQLVQAERRAVHSGGMIGDVAEDQREASLEIDGLLDSLDQLDVESDLEASSRSRASFQRTHLRQQLLERVLQQQRKNQIGTKMKLSDAFPSRYLRAGDLDGATQDVVAKVTQELVGDDTKLVAQFRDSKSLVLNKTNGKMLAELARSEETDDWVGLEVELFPSTTDFRGDRVPCVRIRRPLPREHDADAPVDDQVPF